MTRLIQKEFMGRGEVKGSLFTLIDATEKAYFFQRQDQTYSEAPIYYEVFVRKVNTQFDMEAYPKSKSFGKWAWCFMDRAKAQAKFEEIK